MSIRYSKEDILKMAMKDCHKRCKQKEIQSRRLLTKKEVGNLYLDAIARARAIKSRIKPTLLYALTLILMALLIPIIAYILRWIDNIFGQHWFFN